MKELSHEASVLVNMGREAFRPTEADHARLMVAITGAATLTVGAAAAATGVQRVGGGIFNLVHAARWLAVALPVATVGALGWQAAGAPPAKVLVRPALVRPAVVAASPARAQLLPPREEAAPTSEPVAVAEPERSAARLAETKRDNEIRQEVALLSKAQAALSRGRPQEALAALSEHAQRFPRGALTEERVATRARTLCALGRMQEGEAELKRMAKLNPGSPYLARARESCNPR